MIFKLLISTAVFHFAHGLTLSCVPGVPGYLSNMTCTCRNPTKNGVEWRLNSQIVNTCSGTEDNCFPPSLQYTSSVSSDEFYIAVSPYSYTDCATYICRDLITGEEVSATTSIADFDKRSIAAQEPGANTDGKIMVITGCVFPTSDITVAWYKIEKGKEEDFTAIQSSDRSDCSRTCNTETAEKVESGFTHTEYTGSDYMEVTYKVSVTHNLYIDEVFTWTSSKYRLKAVSGYPKNIIVVVLSIVLGSIGIICLVVVIIVIYKRCLNKHFSLAIGIGGFVLNLASLGLSASVLVDADCKDCEDWILNSAIAFVTIPSIVAVTAIVVFILICCGVIELDENGVFRSIRFDDGTNESNGHVSHRNTDCADTHRGKPSERANSDGEVSRKDVHVQENRDNFSGRPMPPIPLTDKKGRGLSAYYDDDHPMITVGIPDKRAGDLGPLDEEPRKKKKKKRKQVNDDDDE